MELKLSTVEFLYLTTEGKMIEWRWPDFTPAEMLCRCRECDSVIDEQFMDDLQALRDDFGHGMVITSGHRCQIHNRNIGGALDSDHLKAVAADVAVGGAKAYDLIGRAIKHGFNRLGVNQRGDSRFIHLGKSGSQRVIWSY